ncbi:MAG: hypothetical protein JRN54_00320 [Nitrososphaerota archaeon]|jgi:diaminopimelate decarboxylase|nr:hypothetical protein [Nitrososphaerota archaeon]
MICRVCLRPVEGGTEGIIEHFTKDATHRDAALAVANESNAGRVYAYRLVGELCEAEPTLLTA